MPYHSAAPYGTYTCNKSIIYVTALYSTSYIANGPFSLPGTLLARPVHFSQPKLYSARYNFRPVQFCVTGHRTESLLSFCKTLHCLVMGHIRLEPPEAFCFKNPDGWSRWIRRFEQFRVTSGLDKEAGTKQVSTLLHCLGEEAEMMLSSTYITDMKEQSDYKKVVDRYFLVRRNVIFERARFNRRDQETAERYT